MAADYGATLAWARRLVTVCLRWRSPTAQPRHKPSYLASHDHAPYSRSPLMSHALTRPPPRLSAYDFASASAHRCTSVPTMIADPAPALGHLVAVSNAHPRAAPNLRLTPLIPGALARRWRLVRASRLGTGSRRRRPRRRCMKRRCSPCCASRACRWRRCLMPCLTIREWISDEPR